ncbi:MAG: DUF3047 domain-containing protein [Gammaproteobacteria bacterium]
MSLETLKYGLFSTFILLSAASAPAQDIIEAGSFSAAGEGKTPPVGWEPLIFPKIPKHTEYELIKDGDSVVVKAVSEAAASGLTRKITIDLKKTPILQWRWKVDNVIQKSDVASKEGDDYAARIYITFAYEPDKVSFGRKLKYNTGKLLFGSELPIGAINYIWESKTPKDMIVDNAYTDFVKMIVVESGAEKVGHWAEESRNVYEDYKKAFGEEPPMISGIAIMTDTDNTGETATAYYGDIIFKNE